MAEIEDFVPVKFTEPTTTEHQETTKEGIVPSEKPHFHPELFERYEAYGVNCFRYYGDPLDLEMSPKFRRIGEKEFLYDEDVRRGNRYFGRYTRHVYIMER